MINPTLPKHSPMNSIEIVSASGKTYCTDHKCPFCGSCYGVSRGKRRECKECHRTFSINRKRQYFPKDMFPGVKDWSEDNRKNPPAWKRTVNDDVTIRREV